MEKPDLKDALMAIGEDMAKRVVTEIVRPYAEYYISNSENKIDDIMLPFMDQLESAVLDLLDDIHKEAPAPQ